MKVARNIQYITADLSNLPRNFSPDVIAGRVESGPLQINDDWPGFFIRGDNAGWYEMILNQSIHAIENKESVPRTNLTILKNLANNLNSCIVKSHSDSTTSNLSDSLHLDCNDIGC